MFFYIFHLINKFDCFVISSSLVVLMGGKQVEINLNISTTTTTTKGILYQKVLLVLDDVQFFIFSKMLLILYLN